MISKLLNHPKPVQISSNLNFYFIKKSPLQDFIKITLIVHITEEDGRKLKSIYIDLILKISVFLVFI